jgi:hypothetical protein
MYFKLDNLTGLLGSVGEITFQVTISNSKKNREVIWAFVVVYLWIPMPSILLKVYLHTDSFLILKKKNW